MSNQAAALRRMNVEEDALTHGMLVTERLCLQPMQSDDLEALHPIVVQIDVRRYLFDERTLSREEVGRMLATSMRHFVETGMGLWGIRTHDSTQLIGFACLWPFQVERGAEPRNELEFALDGDHQNQGYATEACRGLIRYAGRRLGWSSLHASTALCNNSANRVLWRLHFIESLVVRGRVGPVRIFKLDL